jgi:predicted DNA binding CopG/RHH family protein
MKKKIKYSEGEIGKVERVSDFLPEPKNLILKDDSIKVTISLSRDSVDFFKNQASKYHVPYQKMIKALLNEYASHYQERKKA